MYLLDTNVVSELRRVKPHGAVVAWIQSVPSSALFISAVTLGEIQSGIEKTRENDPQRATVLECWADEVCHAFGCLPVTVDIYRQSSKLLHGRSRLLYEDALIAATAQIHGLSVVTRNVKDFEAFGLSVINPFH